MEYNKDRVDEMVLALLYLTSFQDEFVTRAWKGMDWGVMDRLHKKGFISNPKGRAKSVVLTEDGKKRSKALFITHFGVKE
jgi:hypothetical protein